MRTRTEILARIAAYLEQTGTTERQFALKVTGNHKWVGRLRRGHVSLQSIERAEALLDERPVPVSKSRAPQPAEAAQ